MHFVPAVHQELSLAGRSYRFAEHPASPGSVYGQEGRQATVYQLRGGSGTLALKVFKPTFRVPSMVRLATHIGSIASVPGLAVCQRTVLHRTDHADLLRAHPDLTYAVLMPWVDGPTWMDVLLDRRHLTSDQSLTLLVHWRPAWPGWKSKGWRASGLPRTPLGICQVRLVR